MNAPYITFDIARGLGLPGIDAGLRSMPLMRQAQDNPIGLNETEPREAHFRAAKRSVLTRFTQTINYTSAGFRWLARFVADRTLITMS